MEIRVMPVASRYLKSVMGRLDLCYAGHSEPESRVHLMQCLQGAMTKGIQRVDNGQE